MTLSASIAIRRAAGFTLLELALVLVVVSLMAGFGVQLFRVTTDAACYRQTQERLSDIKQALDAFARKNNRYPKPAIMTVGSTSARYGVEAPISYAPDTLDYAKAAPASIAFVTLSTPVSGEPALPASSKVLIGALPHVALGLPNDYAADCWGNKYVYAITNYLTSSNAAGYPAQTGRVRIHAGTAAAPAVLTNRAAYAVISPGQNRYGANPLTTQDLAYRACALDTARLETQNCNISNAIGTADEIFFTAPFNDVPGATNQFDDLIIYSEKYEALTDCPAGASVTWGASNECGVTLPTAMGHGTSRQAVTNMTVAYYGTATLTCNAGGLTVTNGVCSNAATSPCASGCKLNASLPAAFQGVETTSNTQQCSSTGCVAVGTHIQTVGRNCARATCVGADTWSTATPPTSCAFQGQCNL